MDNSLSNPHSKDLTAPDSSYNFSNQHHSSSTMSTPSSIEPKGEHSVSHLEHQSQLDPVTEMDEIEIAKAAAAAGAYVPFPSDELSDADKIVARRLLWKVDLWILPTVTLVYLMAAMDRSDIGNAQVAGMQKALGVSNALWPNIVSLFYVGFILAQPFGTLLLRRLTPPVVIGFSVLLWGTATVCLLAVTTYSQAIGLRVIIGIGEGLAHAVPLYLSLWYTPYELAYRGALFYASSSLAGAFNGLIAYGITTNLSNRAPYQPWQWLFLVEGTMAIAVGVFASAILPPAPEKLRWGFTPDEKRLAIRRTRQANNTPFATVQWRQVVRLCKMPMLYSWTILLCCNQIALTSLSSFLPTVVAGMGFSSTNAQLMTVPVYAVACVSTILFGYLSDKTQKRGPWLVCLSCISVLGYVLLIAIPTNQAARYGGICLAAAGQYASVSILLTWVSVNLRGFTERATASAVINMVAQAVSLGAVQAFTTPPLYTKGNSVVLAVTCLSPLVSCASMWYIRIQNQKKRAAQFLPETTELRERSFEDLGSDHPDFFFQV